MFRCITYYNLGSNHCGEFAFHCSESHFTDSEMPKSSTVNFIIIVWLGEKNITKSSFILRFLWNKWCYYVYMDEIWPPLYYFMDIPIYVWEIQFFHEKFRFLLSPFTGEILAIVWRRSKTSIIQAFLLYFYRLRPLGIIYDSF